MEIDRSANGEVDVDGRPRIISSESSPKLSPWMLLGNDSTKPCALENMTEVDATRPADAEIMVRIRRCSGVFTGEKMASNDFFRGNSGGVCLSTQTCFKF